MIIGDKLDIKSSPHFMANKIVVKNTKLMRVYVALDKQAFFSIHIFKLSIIHLSIHLVIVFIEFSRDV